MDRYLSNSAAPARVPDDSDTKVKLDESALRQMPNWVLSANIDVTKGYDFGGMDRSMYDAIYLYTTTRKLSEDSQLAEEMSHILRLYKAIFENIKVFDSAEFNRANKKMNYGSLFEDNGFLKKRRRFPGQNNRLYVLMKEESQKLLRILHLKSGHACLDNVLPLFVSRFSYGVKEHSIHDDYLQIQKECKVCFKNPKPLFSTNDPIWKTITLNVFVSKCSRDFQLYLRGFPDCVEEYNSRVLVPIERITQTDYKEISRLLLDFTQCTDHCVNLGENRNRIRSRRFIVDTDGQLRYKNVKNQPLVVCDEDQDDMVAIIHKKFCHIPFEYIVNYIECKNKHGCGMNCSGEAGTHDHQESLPLESSDIVNIVNANSREECSESNADSFIEGEEQLRHIVIDTSSSEDELIDAMDFTEEKIAVCNKEMEMNPSGAEGGKSVSLEVRHFEEEIDGGVLEKEVLIVKEKENNDAFGCLSSSEVEKDVESKNPRLLIKTCFLSPSEMSSSPKVSVEEYKGIISEKMRWQNKSSTLTDLSSHFIFESGRLKWKIVEWNPSLLCQEHVKSVAEVVHSMLAHVNYKYMFTVLSRSVYCHGLKRALRRVEEQCAMCQLKQPFCIQDLDFEDYEALQCSVHIDNPSPITIDWGSVDKKKVKKFNKEFQKIVSAAM